MHFRKKEAPASEGFIDNSGKVGDIARVLIALTEAAPPRTATAKNIGYISLQKG